MSISNDPDRFFQTSDSLAERNRKARKSKNKAGGPIRLESKVLALIPDPEDENYVYVGEATGTARKLGLESGESRLTYQGPGAPLTTLALLPSTLFAGCWDQSIWSWPLTGGGPGPRFRGHRDFVKCLVAFTCAPAASAPGLSVLISGSADASIIVWNASSGEKLSVLNGHGMGVLSLALDPTMLPEQATTSADSAILFSASTDREILRWTITPTSSAILADQSSASAPKLSVKASLLVNSKPLLLHETTVYALCFSPAPDHDLHTASADGTSLILSRHHDWTVETTLAHGGHVRCVAVSADGNFVATAGRNETVKVWDSSSGELVDTLEGHYDEVMSVCFLPTSKGIKIVSAGLDATVRVWTLDPGRRLERQAERDGEVKKNEGGHGNELEGLDEDELDAEISTGLAKVELTAEEEAELAELAALEGDDDEG